MRRCLCPGRLLRTGRGPTASRPLAVSHPPKLRAQIRHSSTDAAITSEEHSFIISYNSYKDCPIKSSAKFDPDAWIPYLSQCARPPRKLEKPADPPGSRGSLTQHKDDLDRVHTLMGYLWTARKDANLSLLAHMGFRHKQWSTVHALLSEFVDAYELLIPYMPVLHPQVGFDWASTGLTLNQLLSETSKSVETQVKPLRSDNAPLDLLTSRPVARGLGERILAELFQNVGSLVLAAADHSPEESKLAMSSVFRILARLHNMGLVSDRVYQFSSTDPSLLSCRPPGLHLLSSHIMTVLSDAAWKEHESALTAAATEAGEDPPYLPFQVGVRELGPEIWLELILWCCVEHGFTKHGAKLVEEMTLRTGDQAWKAESWAPLLQALDVVQQTNISTEQSWRRPGSDSPPQVFKGPEKPPFNGLGKRMISSEVVACLRSGLSNQAYNGVGYWGTRPPNLLKFSAPLTAMLDPSATKDELRPTNRLTNWHIIRMLDSGSLRPNQDPATFERVLRSTQDFVPPWDGDGVADGDQLRDLTRAQIYDQSAAMVGLLEYNIKASAKQRRVGQAFHQFAWLQNIVDAGKVQHIRTFFESLSQSKAANVLFFDDTQQLSPRVQETSLPQVSIVTLAELLDLASGSRSYEFGNWLLFNKDVDGPSIPKTAYGNQALAPSILRFAAATQNAKLCEQVLGSLEMPLSANTLKSLINYHIAMGEWDRVVMTLKYLRDYRLKAWGFSNLTALGAKIIRLHASVEDMKKRGKVEEAEVRSLEQAQYIFQQFFRKEYNTPASKNRRMNDYQNRLLVRVNQVFKTLPGPLADLLHKVNFRRPTTYRNRIQYMPDSAFNQLIAAVVDVHGSAAAWRVFTRWCHCTPRPERIRQREGGVTRLFDRREREKLRGDPNFNSEWFAKSQVKVVEPNLNTIRLIAQVAFKEFKQCQKNTPTLSSADEEDSSFNASSPPSSPQDLFFISNKAAYNRPYRLSMPEPTAKYFNGEGRWPSSDAEVVLDRCFCMFLGAGLTFEQIECELPGYVDRLRERRILRERVGDEEVLERFQVMRDDPWMKYAIPNQTLPVPVSKSSRLEWRS